MLRAFSPRLFQSVPCPRAHVTSVSPAVGTLHVLAAPVAVRAVTRPPVVVWSAAVNYAPHCPIPRWYSTATETHKPSPTPPPPFPLTDVPHTPAASSSSAHSTTDRVTPPVPELHEIDAQLAEERGSAQETKTEVSPPASDTPAVEPETKADKNSKSASTEDEDLVSPTAQEAEDEQKPMTTSQSALTPFERSVHAAFSFLPSRVQMVLVKRIIGLKDALRDSMLHLWHGGIEFVQDTKLAFRIVYTRLSTSGTLTRRERRLLRKSAADIGRLFPFSIFVLVPFMEFLLPVALKLFPNMLPRQFQSKQHKEKLVQDEMKEKLEMANNLIGALPRGLVKPTAEQASHIKARMKLLEEESNDSRLVDLETIQHLTNLLDNENLALERLSRRNLEHMCRFLNIHPGGSNAFMCMRIRDVLEALREDDKLIEKEGIENLTLSELQSACRERGMRSYGLSKEAYRRNLQNWITLSLKGNVPPSILILSRAFALQASTNPTDTRVRAILTAMKEDIIDERGKDEEPLEQEDDVDVAAITYAMLSKPTDNAENAEILRSLTPPQLDTALEVISTECTEASEDRKAELAKQVEAIREDLSAQQEAAAGDEPPAAAEAAEQEDAQDKPKDAK